LIEDKNFVILLHFMEDLTEKFQKYSKTLQLKTSVIVETHSLIQKLSNEIEEIGLFKGDKLTKVLKALRNDPENIDEVAGQTLARFKASGTLYWKGQSLVQKTGGMADLDFVASGLVARVRLKSRIIIQIQLRILKFSTLQ